MKIQSVLKLSIIALTGAAILAGCTQQVKVGAPSGIDASLGLLGSFQFNSVSFSPEGSFQFNAITTAAAKLTIGDLLRSNGAVSGLGNTDVKVYISGTGNPEVTCFNNGGNSAPGQTSITVTGSGSQLLPASLFKNGKSPYSVVTETPVPSGGLDWQTANCPNDKWVPKVTYVFWDIVTLTVLDESVSPATGRRNVYDCDTTRQRISCVLVSSTPI